jgi:signal transduction histidine kinase
MPTAEQIERSAPAHAPRPNSLEDLHEVLQMYNDVTQRLQISHERLEQEVVRLTEQLEQKNRELELKKRLAALGEMAAGIAHEIRNPLGGIQLYASTLAGEVSDRPLALDLVKKISSGVKGLNALVSDMLTFTRDLHLQTRPEGLADIVTAAADLAAPALLENHIDVQLEASLLDAHVQADARLLQRVLLNLILNAADAIAEAAPKTEGALKNEAPSPRRITIAAATSGKYVHLTLTDTGPGIPADLLEKIFDPFFTTKHTGTGLGLAIVHRIIESHGGTITARNQPAPASGAIFTITLPAAIAGS